jgi:hypothetical protein
MYNYGEVLMFNVRERKLMWRFAEENSMGVRLLGFTDGGEKLWIFGQNTGFLCLDTKTGNKESYGMPQTMDGTSLSLSYYNYTVMDSGVIYTHTKDWGTNKMYLVTFDTAALQSAAMEICDVGVLDFGSDSSILAVNDGRVYFWEDAAKQLYIVDPASGEKETLPLATAAQPIVQFLDDGKTTMISQDSNVVFYEGDKMLFEKDLKDLRGVAAYRTEQQILVLTDSGLFLRYDLAGEKLAEIESYLYSDYFSSLNADYRPEDIVWTLTGDGDLFVNIFSSGNLIDMDNWEVRAWIPACIAYVAEADVFAVTGKDPDTNRSRIGLYERYSLERIMEMARAALGDYTLTEEQKKSYGIS